MCASRRGWVFMVFFPVASFASFFLIIVENTRRSLCISLVGIFLCLYFLRTSRIYLSRVLYSNDKLHPQPVLHFLSFLFFFFYYMFTYFPITFFKWNYYVLRPFVSLFLLLIKMDFVASRNLKPHRDVAGSKEIKFDWSFYYIPIGRFLVSLRGEWNYRVACKKGIRNGSYVKETDSSAWTTIISFWTNDATIIVSLYLAQADVRFKLKLAYILSAFDYFMLHNYFPWKLD